MAITDNLSFRAASQRLLSYGSENTVLLGRDAARVSSVIPQTPVGRRTSRLSDTTGPAYMVDDDVTVLSFDAQSLAAGFAGDCDPRYIVRFGPQASRRAGLYMSGSSQHDERTDTADDWELWALDVRDMNLDLMEDKLERALRNAHDDGLMIDLKTKSAVVVLPTRLADPLVNVILKVVFESAQLPPTITLLNNSIACLMAAGLRSALIVDLGWHETSVSALYDYRTVAQCRTQRAIKSLCHDTHAVLASAAGIAPDQVSFGVIQDMIDRMAWCPPRPQPDDPTNLAVDEGRTIRIDLTPKKHVNLPTKRLASLVEEAYFAVSDRTELWDDNLAPLHFLAWSCLSRLSHDVRGICISRIIVTGRGSRMLGMKARLLCEVAKLIETRGYDPVTNSGSAKKTKSVHPGPRDEQTAIDPMCSEQDVDQDHDTQTAAQTVNPTVLPPHLRSQEDVHHIERHVRPRERDGAPSLPPQVRGIETLGAWSGASLFARLGVQGGIEIRRDDFAKTGLRGAMTDAL